MQLPAINPVCGVNLGGLTGCVRVYPVANVLSVPPLVAGKHVGDLVLDDAENYMDIWFSPGSAQFVEPEDEGDQGSLFKPKLSLDVAKDDPDLAVSLAHLRRLRYFLLVYQDGNGLAKLVGTPETPLRFSGAFETGERGGDKNMHRLTFSGEAVDVANFYKALVVVSGSRRAFSSGFSFGFS